MALIQLIITNLLCISYVSGTGLDNNIKTDMISALIRLNIFSRIKNSENNYTFYKSSMWK